MLQQDDSNLYMYDNKRNLENSSKSGKKNDSGKKVSLSNKKLKKNGSNKKDLTISPKLTHPSIMDQKPEENSPNNDNIIFHSCGHFQLLQQHQKPEVIL